MLIDNEKFIALLADNSGIEKEKVEKYLEELISEMKSSFDEGEGYEVEGFGIFSKLGSNILFIPSDELETEINYKYVGMEPIELPGGAQQQESEEPEEEDENPIQGILDGGKTEEYEDPFAELFNEAEEHEKAEKEQAEKGDLSEEEIEAVVEEEIESEDTEEIITEEPEKEEEPEEALEDTLKDIFGSDETEEETETEEEPEPEEESAPGPENWGIDAHKEEEQEGAFSGLLGDAEEEPELIDEDDIFATEDEIASEEDVSEPEDEVSQEETVSEEENDEEIDFSALEDDSSDEDFDDPFDELIEEEDDEDFVPVVTNVSSGKASKKEADEDKEEDEDEKTEKKSRTPKSPRDRKQSSPVFLYMILVLVLLGGTGYLLAYFGVVNIEGITPSSASTQVAQSTPPATQPESTPPQTADTEEEQPVKEVPAIEANNENTPNETEENIGNTSDPVSEITEEETPQNQENDIAPLVADEKAPGDGGIISPVNIQAETEVYGLNGTATEAGNNGYTIVLYTLSRKSGADTQFEKLSKEGFRVIIKEKPSQEFGRLYRVSIGQFESLADAAIAAEKVDSEILGNYIITKI
ncbi:MAG: SPOR domain-containing protein [Balneola sp.]